MSKDEFLRPLRPLRHQVFDDSQYLDIDSMEKKFEAFKTKFSNQDREAWITKGHLVIVTGDSGYGKTSLIRRCAAWLRYQAQGSTDCEIVPVDLSDEGFREETPMSARIRETLEFILDALGMRITVDQRAEIENAYANSAPSAFRRLAGLLSSRSNSGKALPPIVLVVLLRRYSSPAEIAEYYDLARQGMIFFAEAFAELDAVKERERRFDREEADSLLLELDVLKTGDADLLIRRIRAEAGYLPEVNAEVLRDIESIIASPPPMGAGELARMAGGALRIAAAEAAPELETRHIVQYWRQAPPGNARD